MATVQPPIDPSLWSSAGPMPEDYTPSEQRLSGRIDMLKREMRIAHDYTHQLLVNRTTPIYAILAVNTAGMVALLFKAFG